MAGDLVGAVRAALAAREAGIPEPLLQMAIAVAMAESMGDPDAIGDTDIENEKWGPSVGLTQLRTLRSQRGTGGPRDIERVRDPLENMRAAYELLQGQNFTSGGKTWYEPGGWDQWSTVTSGRYEDFMPLAEQAIKTMKDINVYDRLG